MDCIILILPWMPNRSHISWFLFLVKRKQKKKHEEARERGQGMKKEEGIKGVRDRKKEKDA